MDDRTANPLRTRVRMTPAIWAAAVTAAALLVGGCATGAVAPTAEQIRGFTWPAPPAEYEQQIRDMLARTYSDPSVIEYRIGRLQRGWVARQARPWVDSVCEPFWIAHVEMRSREPDFLGTCPHEYLVAVFNEGKAAAWVGLRGAGDPATAGWVREEPRYPSQALVGWLPEDDDAPIPPPVQTVPLKRPETPAPPRRL